MISLAYYQHFVDAGCCPERFIRMAQVIGMKDADEPQDFITVLATLQKSCGVDALKMSDFGFQADKMDKIAVNMRETMGGLFLADFCELTHEDCVEILKKSYR